ncbi:hypothetical protein Q2K19_16905 [Micromonospora soli]|uniref:hypothetical protein n=1 Tax=Micromonospora sp. NBRC 110009 TaxID=3061627 RepID=UPI002671F3DB|nr:hypothetical protein [Micromonospora sp. NBRC 110009]WKU02028.1 hypothetical protein Q2K19_16905 [Micromonospora sp. NBRC 110009]
MFPDFYATAAQVLPVLMLALIWESRFLDRLEEQNRRSRREDPKGVLFWTRPRVRAYSLFIVVTIMIGTALALLVLAEALPPGPVPRTVLTICVLLALATLLTRVVVDVVGATAPRDRDRAPSLDPEPAGQPRSHSSVSTGSELG